MPIYQTPRKYVFWRHSNWSVVTTISMSSFDPAFDRSTKVTVISRSLRTKNPWYVSVFCRFDLLDGFFTLKKFFAMNSGSGKSFCVVYYVQLLNRAGLTKRRSVATVVLFRIVKNNDGYPIKAEDWFCVWIFCKEFEDRRNFKCNMREMIEVHVNLFCFVKIFTLTQ